MFNSIPSPAPRGFSRTPLRMGGLILSVIGSVLAFDKFYIMTRGGPRNSTIPVVYWIFNNSFTYFKMGYGAAMSIVLLVVLVLLSAVQFYLLRDNT